MNRKFQERVRILSQEQISDGIFSMWVQTRQIAEAAGPGQFVSVYCEDRSRLLPRPISICEIDPVQGALRLVYRTAGKGTQEFSQKKAGEELDLLGPLGNGYPLPPEPESKAALLIGGGIGIPPLLELAKRLPGEKAAILGYRSALTPNHLFLAREFEKSGCRCYIATEDGSAGTKGTVLDCIREHSLSGDVIYSCGPTPMLRAVKGMAAERDTLCYLSLEERMACGIGACLACVCRSTQTDEHSRVQNKRVCAEGPVFPAEEVEL